MAAKKPKDPKKQCHMERNGTSAVKPKPHRMATRSNRRDQLIKQISEILSKKRRVRP